MLCGDFHRKGLVLDRGSFRQAGLDASTSFAAQERRERSWRRSAEVGVALGAPETEDIVMTRRSASSCRDV